MLGVARHIPARSSAEDLEALGAGMRLAAEHGIGSGQEAGGGQDQLELWDALRETGELTLRVRLAFDMVPGLDAETWRERLDLYEELAHGRQADPWVATGILKAFAAGGVESRTPPLLHPPQGTPHPRAPPSDRAELV